MKPEDMRPEVFQEETKFYRFEQIKPNTPVVGKAVRFDYITRRVIVQFGDLQGEIPENEICIGNFKYSKFSNIPYQISSIIGKKVRAVVTSVLEDGTILLSRTFSMREAWEYIKKDMIIQASITSIASCGIFIDLGNGLSSYVSKKDCSLLRYYDLDKWFKVGDKILVKIIEKDSALYQIACSRKEAYSNDININIGDILMVKVGCSDILHDGYFCEYNPNIACIVDTMQHLEEAETIAVRVKNIKDRGIKTSLIK